MPKYVERMVSVCAEAMRKGRADEQIGQVILNCRESVDVSPIEPFLTHPSQSVRYLAAKIVGKRGNVKALLDAALKENDVTILTRMLRSLGLRKAEGIEAFQGLLNSENTLLKEATIDMFRLAGKSDILFPFVFDEDDFVVQRIKRYLNEEENGKTSNP